MKKLYAILVLCGTALHLSAQTPFSDDFGGSVINAGWLLFTPNTADSISLTGSGELLLFASPLNGGSDLYSGTNYNAPRFLQPVDTADHNWTIETKLRFNPTNFYQGAGLAIQFSDDPHDSISTNRITERKYYPAEGGNDVSGPEGLIHFPYTDTIVYFRVSRSTDSIRTWYSADGTTWTSIGSISDQPVYFFGLYCIRQPSDGDNSVNSFAYFDYFNVSLPTGIADNSSTEDFRAYPNPASGYFALRCNLLENEPCTFDIVNMLSQTVWEGTTTGNPATLNTGTSLESGMYILKVTGLRDQRVECTTLMVR